MHNLSALPRRLRFAAALAALLAFLVASGCAGRRPRLEYGSQGTPIQEKRVPRNVEVNYATRFASRAYVHNSGANAKPNSEVQVAILADHGQPDYIRSSYKTTRGDRAYEWAYLEKNKLFQFVRHDLVYEGPLSDKDRVVIQWGYPDHVLMQNDFLGSRRETFIYTDPFDTHHRYFSFADDAMVLGIESH